jgi:hypothetical protein
MPRSVPTQLGKVHCLKVVLQGTDPPVWRRILVRSNTNLADLHHILQRVMGWQDSHLHQFRVSNATYGPSDLADMAPRPKDEARARLATVAPVGGRLVYEYDFGDGWEHIIDVEKVLAANDGEVYPRCLAGERACPPEDCGGAWGYAEMLDTLDSGATPEREEMLEWLGDEFDPEHFDADVVNGTFSPGRGRVVLSAPTR